MTRTSSAQKLMIDFVKKRKNGHCWTQNEITENTRPVPFMHFAPFNSNNNLPLKTLTFYRISREVSEIETI